jgi:hypothetical protein
MSDEPYGDDEFELRVNFSDEEAASEGRDYTPVPTGKYHCCITDYSLEEVRNEPKPGKTDNRGKNFWRLELTCQDGPAENRKFWTNVMLFDGALYSLAQLLKATGHGDVLQRGSSNYGKIPSGDALIGEHVVISVVNQRDTYKDPDGTEGLRKNEVKSFFSYEDSPAQKVRADSSHSLLP